MGELIAVGGAIGSLVVGLVTLGRRLQDRADRRDAEETAELMRGVDAIHERVELRPGIDYTPIIPRPRGELGDAPCADCGASRCWEWRNSGHTTGCGNANSPGNAYVGMEDQLRNPGRHTVSAVVDRWVTHDWSPLPITQRTVLAPTFWDRRLPVPMSTMMLPAQSEQETQETQCGAKLTLEIMLDDELVTVTV